MMAHSVPHQTSDKPSNTLDKRRVKVYELRTTDWFDRGTGLCSTYLDRERGHKDARVRVESEDYPGKLLIEFKITKGDGFRRQQDTLIVWTESDGEHNLDMALSFQEVEGCLRIWKFIDRIQQILQNPDSYALDEIMTEELAMEMSPQIQLPAVRLGNLVEIENVMRLMSNSTGGRDALAKGIMSEDYIDRLIPLVEEAEDLESLQDLHRLCNIMKIVLLLNDTAIIEHAVSDKCVMGVVGALEYDPDFPTHKANHRQWLGGKGRFKEVVKIEDDAIQRKIHQTYRLQYLKDVVLARILDDPTFSVLNSLIFFNQVDIVQHLQCNRDFLDALFCIFTDQTEDQLRKKEAVGFIAQCCAIAKNLQPPARQTLYDNFLSHGLLRVVNFGLRSMDVSVRVGATDVLVAMIDHDPAMIRMTLYRQIVEGQAPLTDALIDLLLVETDLGIKSQVADAIKVLLDPVPPMTPSEAREANKPRALPPADPQLQVVVDNFYSISADKLYRPLLDLEGKTEMKFSVLKEGIFSYLNEIMCFLLRQHGTKSKEYLMQRKIPERVAQLLLCREKHLKLVAIRFFRFMVAMRDHYLDEEIKDKQILAPILDVLLTTIPRDNLLSSACLDLFEHITKDHADLVNHICNNYREKINALSGMETFERMLLHHDRSQFGFVSNFERYMGGLEDDPDLAVRRPPNGAMMEHLVVDPTEEEYWNTSDDDEQNPKAHSAGERINKNEATSSQVLVEYTSDEELDEQADSTLGCLGPGKEELDDSAKENESPSTSGDKDRVQKSPTPPPPPPERLSEKRRREEEEEDELSKLSLNKRRNSTPSGSNNITVKLSSSLDQAGTAVVRSRFSSLSADHDAGAAKKMLFKLSSGIKSAPGSGSASPDAGDS